MAAAGPDRAPETVLWRGAVVVHDRKAKRIGTLSVTDQRLVFIQQAVQTRLGGSRITGAVYTGGLRWDSVQHGFQWLFGTFRARSIASRVPAGSAEDLALDLKAGLGPGSFVIHRADVQRAARRWNGRVHLLDADGNEYALDAGPDGRSLGALLVQR